MDVDDNGYTSPEHSRRFISQMVASKPQNNRRKFWLVLTCLFYSCIIQESARADDADSQKMLHFTYPTYWVVQAEEPLPPIIYSEPLGFNARAVQSAGFLWYYSHHLHKSTPLQISQQWTKNHLPYTDLLSQNQASPINGLDMAYFDYLQQLFLLALLREAGITAHDHRLKTIVHMTQQTGSKHLNKIQNAQSQNWCRKEGADIAETHVAHDSAKKARYVNILNQMNYYSALRIPNRQKLHYTLFLGGSVQEMQWRMLTMLAVMDNYGSAGEIDLGELVALTCDRPIVIVKETQDTVETKNTFFEIVSNNGEQMVEVGPGASVFLHDLTEDTAYKAIHYSLERMCKDESYFASRRETGTGYHPPGYLSWNSPELPYYQLHEEGRTFILTEEFRGAACRFTEKYRVNTFLVPEKNEGANTTKRPSTKRTVRDWADAPRFDHRRHPCQGIKHCQVLAVSNQPNARYQQMAVYQGLLDTLQESLAGTDPLPEITVHLVGAAVSTDIPTDAPFDNLTKHLYLISEHPED